MQASEASEQHVLGRPPADAAQFEQALPDHGVVFPRERLQIQFLSRDRPREVEKRADLLTAEPNRPVLLRRQPRHVLRGGEGVADVAPSFRASRC